VNNLNHQAHTPMRILIAITFCLSALSGIAPGAFAQNEPPIQRGIEQSQVHSPLLDSVRSALAARMAKGLPVPAAVTYTSTIDTVPALSSFAGRFVGAADSEQAQPQKYVISSTVVLHYDSSTQAGLDKWPDLAIVTDTAMDDKGAQQARFTRQQLSTGARAYTLHEVYEVLQAPLPALPTTISKDASNSPQEFDLLMGATYQGPRYRETFTQNCEVLGVSCGFLSFSFAFDSRFGARFPMHVTVNGPNGPLESGPDAKPMMRQGQSYTYTVALEGKDWSADDYANHGIAPMHGHEIALEFSLDLAVKIKVPNLLDQQWVRHFDQDNFPNDLKDFNKDLSSKDYPFTDLLTAKLPPFNIYKIEIPVSNDKISLGINLELDPSVRGNSLRFAWDALDDAQGKGISQITSTTTSITVGPIAAGDFSPRAFATLRLRQFEYVLALLLGMRAITNIHFPALADLELPVDLGTYDVSKLVGYPTLRTHDGTPDTLSVQTQVKGPLEISDVASQTEVTPGTTVDVVTTITNTSTSSVPVSITVVDSHCAIGQFGSLGPLETKSYTCPVKVISDTRHASTVIATTNGGTLMGDTAEIVLSAIDGTIGGGSADTCTPAVFEAELHHYTSGPLRFNCGAQLTTLTLTRPITIQKTLEIDGGSAVALSGNDSTRVFTVMPGAKLTLRNLTLANGAALRGATNLPPDGGGAIHNEGELIVDNCQFVNNEANYGGAIHSSKAGLVQIANSAFLNNRALDTTIITDTGDGGAIFNEGVLSITNTTLRHSHAVGGAAILNNAGGEVTVSNSSLLDNVATNGGAIEANSATVYISDTQFERNSARQYGGALLGFGHSDMHVVGSLLQFNTAVQGGAISVFDSSTLEMTNTQASENDASQYGGALIIYQQGVVKIHRTDVLENTSSGYGGGISNGCSPDHPETCHSTTSQSMLLIDESSRIAGNETSVEGGGIDNWGSTDIVSSTIGESFTASGNDAPHGGGIRNHVGAALQLIQSTVVANQVPGYGGGIHNSGALTIELSTLKRNNAGIDGGGLFNDGQAIVISSTIGGDAPADGNHADSSGGGIQSGPLGQAGGRLSLSDSTVAFNTAGQYGGGIANAQAGILQITNTTISTNQAGAKGGGVLNFNQGTVSMTHATVVFNSAYAQGANIANIRDGGDGVIGIANSIVAYGLGTNECSGVISSNGYNIVGSARSPADTSACDFKGAGDERGIDPGLSTLANNGGPTWTHAPFPSSPAIDHVPCSVYTDQRGVIRPQGKACDAGAFELEASVVSSEVDFHVYPLSPSANDVVLDHFDPTLGTSYGNVSSQPGLANLRHAISLKPGGYIQYAVPSWYSTSPAGTIEFWLRPSAYGEVLDFNWNNTAVTPPAGHIVHLGLDEGTGQLNFTVWNDKSASPSVHSQAKIALNTWSHIAVTWSPNGTKLYINGQLDTWVLDNLYPALQPENYAYLNAWGTGSFVGLVDDLHIARAALSANEIWYHATGVLDRFSRPDGPLSKRWYGPEGFGGYPIRNGQVLVLGGGPIYWNDSRLGKIQETFATLSRVNPNAYQQSVLLKVQAEPPDWRQGAIAVLYDAPNHEIRIETRLPAPMSWEWKQYHNVPLQIYDGDVLRARATATGMVYAYLNDAPVLTETLDATDQAFFNGQGGHIGLEFLGANGALLDDFGGGTISPAMPSQESENQTAQGEYALEELEPPTMHTYLPAILKR